MKSVTQKNIKLLEENAEFILAVDLKSYLAVTYFCDWLIQTVFCGSNFCELGPKSEK